MKFIDWFAGVGGFRKGMEQAGHECVGFCEFDKFAVASYVSIHCVTEEQREYLATLDMKKRQKEILKDEYKNGEWFSADIRRVQADDIPAADCWCFGFPCQDISVAGKQAGFQGNRSSLFFRVMHLLGETPEEKRPHTLFIENVKNLLSVNRGWDFARVLVEMDKIGYDAEWDVLNSKWFGVPQNRERCFVVGHLRGRGGAEVFPVKGTNGADSIRGIGHRNGYRRNTQIFDKGGITEALDTAAGGGRGHHTIEVIGHVRPDSVMADRNRILGGGGRISEPNGNRLQGTVSDRCELVGNTNPSGKGMNGNCYSADGVNPTLTTNKGEGGRIAIPVLTPERANKRQNGRRFKEDGEEAFTLTGQDRHGVAVEVREATKRGYSVARGGRDAVNYSIPRSKTRRGRVGIDMANTLDTGCHQGIFVKLENGNEVYAVWYPKKQCYIAIRKLTPKECFRLQGWSDEDFDKAQFVNSDSQLYKQAGNGVTVSVIKAVAERLGD